MTCDFVPISQWPKFIKNGTTFLVANTPCFKIQGLQLVKQSDFNKTTVVLFANVPINTFLHTKNCLFDIEVIFLDKNWHVILTQIVAPDKTYVQLPQNTCHIIESNPGWINTFIKQ